MATSFVRDNHLDAMRLTLAIAVIFSHSFALASSNAVEPLAGLTHGRIDLGKLAVDGFFIISGFLIPMSFLRTGEPAEFLRRRIMRIYPGFLVALTLTVLVVAPIGGAAISAKTWPDLGASLVLLREWQASDAFVNNPLPFVVNGALWTIRIEFWCYLLTLACGMLGILRRPWAIATLFAIAAALAAVTKHRAIVSGSPAIAYVLGDVNAWPRFASFYLAGTLIFLADKRIPDRRWMTPAAFLFCAVVTATSHTLAAIFLPLPLAYVVFRIAFLPIGPRGSFTRFVGGDYSYGTYLYGWPIQQLVVRWLPNAGPIAVFLIATPPALLAGVASWHLVERRFLRSRRVTATEGNASPITSIASRDSSPIATS